MITFSCEYNYLTTNTVVVNISTKNITQSSLLPKPNPQSFTPVEKNTVLPQTSTSINT